MDIGLSPERGGSRPGIMVPPPTGSCLGPCRPAPAGATRLGQRSPQLWRATYTPSSTRRVKSESLGRSEDHHLCTTDFRCRARASNPHTYAERLAIEETHRNYKQFVGHHGS